MPNENNTNRPLLAEEKPKTDIVKKEDKTKAKPAAERRQAESTKDGGGFMPWIIGALVLLVVLLAVALLFNKGNTKKEEVVQITPVAPVVQNDTTPPATTPAPTPTPAPAPPVVQGVWEQVAPVTRAWEPRGAEVVKVHRWIQQTDSDGTRFWVPLRNQDANGNPLAPGPGGSTEAGYGRTYSNPPEGGGASPDDPAIAEALKVNKANWTRNERGDWAIPIAQN